MTSVCESTMSRTLATLPPELISCIVANIESQSALCNLARCSRQLYLCTIPHLYHDVKIQEQIKPGEHESGKLRNLAFLLLGKSDLARLVRHFTLHVLRSEIEYECFDPFHAYEKSETPISPKSINAYQRFITAETAWASAEREGNNLLSQLSHAPECHYEVILALLLPALLKVETLRLDMDIFYDLDYLGTMVRNSREWPLYIQPSFEALAVFIHSHDIENVKTTSLIALLLKLPAMQEISGGFGRREILGDDDDDDELDEVRVGDINLKELDNSSSPLTRLDLAAYDIIAADLIHILRAPKALKTLSYKICPPAQIRLSDLCHALKPQENHLESVRIDYDNDYYNSFYSGSEDIGIARLCGPIGSFITFSALKDFKIAALFLETTVNGDGRYNLINIFPATLSTLHLTHFHACRDSFLEALEYLLSQKSPEQIPSLKTIALEEDSEEICETPMEVLRRGTQETAMGRLFMVAADQDVSIDLNKPLVVAEDWSDDDDSDSVMDDWGMEDEDMLSDDGDSEVESSESLMMDGFPQ